ncbi:MAG: YdcF family protein [Alphaproteobacteria bacterium]|nr:YdcF family protein [Candidatus Fonsibacter sp. PEL55]
MEFYIAKFVNYLLEPLYILSFFLLILIFFLLFTNLKKLTILFSKFLLILFLFFGYTPLSNFLLNKIEDFIKPSKYPVQQLKGIIVLGGSFNSGLQSRERNEVLLNSSAERLTKVLEIYNKNPKLLILFSGFSGELKPQGWSESDMAKKFFLEQGIKSDNLIFENQSRNTFENIKYSKDIILSYKGTWGLVTSAYHMPRSYFGFKRQGLILEPISVDYQTGTSQIFWINFDIASGLRNWSIIFHETIGISYYKITGKI